MKRKLYLGLLIIGLLLPLSVPVSAAEDTVMIESGSEWEYIVVDDEGFENMDPDWMTLDYDPNWAEGTAPFGDRIDHKQAEKYGWVGENDGLFLRQIFKLRSATVMEDLHFYINTIYDNSIHIYLNGTEIFAHDNGGNSDWLDDETLIKLDDVAPLLRKGANVLAVSVHDNAGGREFDLSFLATVKEIDEAVTPPTVDDKPNNNDPENPALTRDPADFGSNLPFIQSPVATNPPVVTVYVTADLAVDAKPASMFSYTAPLAMVGGALIIAATMVIFAFIISRKSRKPGEGK